MKKQYINQQKGFTLIELLIVVAIIGILSALLMSNFIGVRQRARDGKRKADVAQIQAALEQYRADQGSYPTTSSFPNCGSSLTNGSGTTYMQKVPCDPLGVTYYDSGNYYYSSNGTTYTVTACLENTGDTQGTSNPPSGNPSGCTSVYYYTVTNP